MSSRNYITGKRKGRKRQKKGESKSKSMFQENEQDKMADKLSGLHEYNLNRLEDILEKRGGKIIVQDGESIPEIQQDISAYQNPDTPLKEGDNSMTYTMSAGNPTSKLLIDEAKVHPDVSIKLIPNEAEYGPRKMAKEQKIDTMEILEKEISADEGSLNNYIQMKAEGQEVDNAAMSELTERLMENKKKLRELNPVPEEEKQTTFTNPGRQCESCGRVIYGGGQCDNPQCVAEERERQLEQEATAMEESEIMNEQYETAEKAPIDEETGQVLTPDMIGYEITKYGSLADRDERMQATPQVVVPPAAPIPEAPRKSLAEEMAEVTKHVQETTGQNEPESNKATPEEIAEHLEDKEEQFRSKVEDVRGMSAEERKAFLNQKEKAFYNELFAEEAKLKEEKGELNKEKEMNKPQSRGSGIRQGRVDGDEGYLRRRNALIALEEARALKYKQEAEEKQKYLTDNADLISARDKAKLQAEIDEARMKGERENRKIAQEDRKLIQDENEEARKEKTYERKIHAEDETQLYNRINTTIRQIQGTLKNVPNIFQTYIPQTKPVTSEGANEMAREAITPQSERVSYEPPAPAQPQPLHFLDQDETSNGGFSFIGGTYDLSKIKLEGNPELNEIEAEQEAEQIKAR